VRYRLEVRLTPADVGARVMLRWRRPAGENKNGHGEQVADVLGILESADTEGFTVRTAAGELVTIPAGRALAGKTIPPPARRHRAEPDRREPGQ
jgi:hypothetical protein